MLNSSTPFSSYLSHFAVGFALLLLVLLVVGWQPYVSIASLTRDPAAIADFPLYFGALSHLGVLLWTMSATICLFSAKLLGLWQVGAESARFLQAFGRLSLLMSLDDLFLLHERVFPVVFRGSQTAVLVSYAIMVTALLGYFRKVIIRNQPLFFAASLFLFSLSVLIDLVPLEITNSILSVVFQSKFDGVRYLLEDGLKLLGIFVWLAYLAWVSIVFLTEAKEKARYHSR